MATIRVQAFLGASPKLAPRLLANENAQVALNCNLERGMLLPIKAPLLERRLPGQTVFKFKGSWLVWQSLVDVVKSFVFTENKRIMWTGDGYPKVSDLSLWPACKRLGVPAPTVAPDVEFTDNPSYEAPEITLTEDNFDSEYYVEANPDIAGFIGTEDYPTAWSHYVAVGMEAGLDARVTQDSLPDESEIAVRFSTAYVYTAVNDWGEESAPSPPSAVIDVRESQIPKVIGMTKPVALGTSIASFRVYRTVSGSKTATYQFVAEVPATYSYFLDENEDADLGETCPTVGFNSPPDGLSGLYSASNGVLFGFVGNKLYASETFVPYAFPEQFTVTFEDDIVGVSGFGSTVVVCTEARPYVLTGVSPESMSVTRLPFDMACVSKDSIVSAEDCVIFAAPDGLVTVAESTGFFLLTSKIFSKDQWKALGPENLIGVYYDRKYYGFFKNSPNGFILDVERADVATFTLPFSVVSVHYDPAGDKLYVYTGTDIHEWDGSATFLPVTWKSKEYYTQEPITFDCVKVSGGTGNTFRWYVDGVERHSQLVRSEEVFRLPGGFLGQTFAFSITGTSPVYEVAVSTSTEELVGAANG